MSCAVDAPGLGWEVIFIRLELLVVALYQLTTQLVILSSAILLAALEMLMYLIPHH